MESDAAATFEPHRRYLIKIAYRMLGSVAEAEDVAQDAFLRWSGVARDEIETPRAYLTRIVTRLCVDRLKSARAQREQYVGTWLPEPVVEEPGAELAHELSVALMVTLERLSPLERAAFLLHDVFELEFTDVAEALERSEAAVRQLAARAREHVKDGKPRYLASEEEATRIAGAFHAAMRDGDVAGLSKLLTSEAVLYSDGGGKRRAALNPIYGREHIVRFLTAPKVREGAAAITNVRPVWINGLPGFLVEHSEGVETLAFEIEGEQVTAIYTVRNPDKLRHLAQ